MGSKALFTQTLQQATNTIKCVEHRHFKNPTPCSDWNCHELVNHMLYELSWVPDMLAGKTIAEVGSKYDGDLLGNDLHQTWHVAAHQAADAVGKVDLGKTVHLSYADVTAEDYIHEVSRDLLIHSWDTDQSLQTTLIFDPQVAQIMYDDIWPRRIEFAASGLFGSTVQVAKSSRLQTKLLALLGRREPVW